jgi:glycosyltransferase involved in cell wall biosynthesis
MASMAQPTKPRLLLVSRKWPPAVGGMETYSVELADTLAAQFDVHALVLHGRADGRPPSLPAYAAFVLRAMLFCLLRGRRFDYVVLTDLIVFPAALCHRIVAPRGRRLVVVHGLDMVFHLRGGLPSRAYALYFAAFRSCQRIFRAMVANSANTAALARQAGLAPVVVVNPCLPRGGLASAVADASNLPAQWSAAPRRILYFGRLVPRKGALWFAQSVLPALPDCIFFVAGAATDRDYARTLAGCQRTVCLGRVDAAQLAAMIRAADAVVMPNIPTPAAVDAEGFGLAAVETAALGGRLLAASIDGIGDAVVDGVTGRLLPPANAAAWIQAAREAMEVPLADRDCYRAGVAAAAVEAFSSQRQLAGFLEVLLDPP